ncbi:MAG: molybdopterin converting factor subunit 1, partial [Terriglobia bacterium]
MKVQVLYFAYCRDLMGCEREWLTLDESARVSDLLAKCLSEKPALEPLKKNLLVAVNQEYARTDHRLVDGDEVAIFPPVSGGAAATDVLHDFFAITKSPIGTA